MPVSRKFLGAFAAVVICLIAPATALALELHAHATAHHRSTHVTPSSVSTNGVAQIGALYPAGNTTAHDCTASVVDSPQGNTLITAAHCVSGSGAGMTFVPDARAGRNSAPYGRWTVTAAHVTPRWASGQDPQEDVAFLTVAPQVVNGKSTDIQQVTGGYRLGSTGRAGQQVRVTGYVAGTNDNAITCLAKIYKQSGYPAFDCGGYANGTSGSPWLLSTRSGQQIVGVIGGFHQGGCVESTSYSPLVGSDAYAAYLLASSGSDPDDAPAPGGNGC